jgi:hypothetical protein
MFHATHVSSYQHRDTSSWLRIVYALLLLLVAFVSFATGSLIGQAIEKKGGFFNLFSSSSPQPVLVEEAVDEEVTKLSPEMERVKDYLARRYRVSGLALQPLIVAAHRVGATVEIDPLLLIAVMAIESSFNPFAESHMGALGLMQVMPRIHADKLEEGQRVDGFLDPQVNIRVGAQILKDSILRAGSLQGGLQRYAGAMGDPDAEYASKVIAEKERLLLAARKGRA